MKEYRTFFFYLSGELPSKGLPSNEVISILKSHNKKIKNIRIYDQVLLISSDNDISGIIAKRAAYVHRCCKLIFNISNVTIKKIEKKLQQQSEIDIVLKKNSSFAVRIKKIKTYFQDISEEEIERKIGHLIKRNSNKYIRVNLINPDVLFYGIFTEENFIFGVNLQEVQRYNIRQRAPHTRPFFHPCGLDPFLARAMINLSEINQSKILYDPFCGSGSILIEAALMGFITFGSDIDQKMLKGSILNLRSLNIQNFNIFRSDARKPCVNKINCLVTDPPYGRSTRIELGKKNPDDKISSSFNFKNFKLLLSDFFRNIVDVIEKDSLCIMTLPSMFEIDVLILSYKFKIQQKFEYFMHKSLTRNILILKKI